MTDLLADASRGRVLAEGQKQFGQGAAPSGKEGIHQGVLGLL